MTKSESRILTVLFCIFLGGILVWHVALPDAERSAVENRTLAQFPEFSWSGLMDGSYAQKVENYFADQFPLRDAWTGMKARAEQAVGKQEFHEIYLCGDRLIAAVAPPDEALLQRNLSSLTQLAEHVPVIVGLIPSAADIWQEKLPAGAPSWNQTDLLEQVRQTGLKQIDFRTTLQRHREEPVFYRTDHHWTSLGAYYGYTAVMHTLGKQPFAKTQFQPETVSTRFQGTLYSQSGVHWLPPDTIEFWVPETGLQVTSWRAGKPEPSQLYDRAYLDKKDQYAAFLGGNQPLCVIANKNAAEKEKLLLVRDSYSDALAPFLAQHYEEVHLVDLRYYRGSVKEYVNTQGIDTVLVLYSIPNFITDQNLVLVKR